MLASLMQSILSLQDLTHLSFVRTLVRLVQQQQAVINLIAAAHHDTRNERVARSCNTALLVQEE